MIMRVVVAFYDLRASEASDLGDAFWLADTPINRAIAEEAWVTKSTHSNSATFQASSDAVEDDDVLERLGDIDLHHPKWSEVEFLAVPLTPELQKRLLGCGAIAERYADGFKVTR